MNWLPKRNSTLLAQAVAVAAMMPGLLSGQVSTPNIDNACAQVLGSACSTNSQLYSTYQAIVIQINSRKLAPDVGSIIYNYLIPMVKSSTAWQFNVIDWAWRAAGCGGTPAETYWQTRYGTSSGLWQTYQQLYNVIKATPGCLPSSTPEQKKKQKGKM